MSTRTCLCAGPPKDRGAILVATLAAVKTAPPDPYASGEGHHNEGHGRRLPAAFEALEAYPVLAESRNRVLRLFEDGDPATADVVAAIEGDVALAVTVLRLANQLDGEPVAPGPHGIWLVQSAHDLDLV